MPAPKPSLLTENAGLAFLGEKAWPPAVVTAVQVRALETARNPTGRPNRDVLRRFIGVRAGRTRRHFQVDFPPHFTAPEATLYLAPGRRLHAQLGDRTGSWWRNPCAQPDLRNSLARLERYLATPFLAATPVWDWIDSTVLPDDTLLAVARDDDFTHGLLASQLFQLWWRQCSAMPPTASVASFPFPWPPATRLSSLTRTQEERRLGVARAARGSNGEQLNAAVAAAYGWPAGLSEAELRSRLADLNRQRAPVGL